MRRNKVKRVFREVYRRNKPANQNPPFFDILIKPKLRIDIEKLNFHEQTELFNSWQNKVGRDFVGSDIRVKCDIKDDNLCG